MSVVPTWTMRIYYIWLASTGTAQLIVMARSSLNRDRRIATGSCHLADAPLRATSFTLETVHPCQPETHGHENENQLYGHTSKFNASEI